MPGRYRVSDTFVFIRSDSKWYFITEITLKYISLIDALPPQASLIVDSPTLEIEYMADLFRYVADLTD